ncbi:uncharacterized protein [Ranitomeya imitator]|uniref:uncharacterized protein n=1 Tax=Ranitomeya imitator TaxID=111125 RepID=UPI0037E95D45
MKWSSYLVRFSVCYYLFSVLCTGPLIYAMDFRAREKAWLEHMDKVFDGGVAGSHQQGDPGWDKKFADMKSLLDRRLRLWWNRSFLGKYISNGMIPRGLRVRVVPSFPVDDVTFINKWEEACNNCSAVLMQLLVDMNTTSINDLDGLIDTAQAEIRSGCPPDRIQQFESSLEKSTDDLVKRIQNNQRVKYTRDLKDYQSKSVYLWRKRNSSHLQRSGSSTSISSLSGQSDVSSISGSAADNSGAIRLRDHDYHPYKRKSLSVSHKDNKVINLTQHPLSATDLSLLGRGLSFAPTSGFNLFSTIKDLHIFARSLLFKRYFNTNRLHSLFPTEEEQEALRILEELASEHMGEGVSLSWMSFGAGGAVLSYQDEDMLCLLCVYMPMWIFLVIISLLLRPVYDLCDFVRYCGHTYVCIWRYVMYLWAVMVEISVLA